MTLELQNLNGQVQRWFVCLDTNLVVLAISR